jgi:hypothetical protein
MNEGDHERTVMPDTTTIPIIDISGFAGGSDDERR